MDDRKLKILAAVVDEYVQTGEPSVPRPSLHCLISMFLRQRCATTWRYWSS